MMVQSSIPSVVRPAMQGAVLLRAAVAPAVCAQWLQAVERAMVRAMDPACAAAAPSADADADANADATPPRPARTLVALHEAGVLDAQQVLRAVAGGAAGPLLADIDGERPTPSPAREAEVVCHLGQSWLRHGHPPHSWHQDGALQFDFAAQARSGRPPAADALLPMRTCWLALTPCGLHAPGLQWVQADTQTLLMPEALTDAAVLQRYGPAARRHAVMQAGDALVFDGSLLHRTQTGADLGGRRTSLELRFFSAPNWPTRLQGLEQRMALPQSWVLPAQDRLQNPTKS